MRIYVGGSLRNVPRDPELCRQFAAALGVEVVMRGHVLLSGGRSSLDEAIAAAAHDWLEREGEDPKSRIISYCLKDEKPVHSLGTIRHSALSDWQMNHSELDVPEQIDLAGATIFVAGSEGTFWAKNWASLARKMILGVPRFGGAGEEIYEKELKRLREAAPAQAEDYEALNSLSDDMSGYATEVVRLVERMLTPRNVFAVMSFEPLAKGALHGGFFAREAKAEGAGGHFWHDAVTKPNIITPRHECYPTRTDPATLERDSARTAARVEERGGPADAEAGAVIHTLEWVRIEEFTATTWCGVGRPPCERAWLANAFVAKAVLGLTTTVGLIERLTVDRALRRICGFPLCRKLPSEATFSRAFDEFAEGRLPNGCMRRSSRSTSGMN
jgi:hypothetical protein